MWVSDTRRRRLSKHGAYMATAYAAIDRKLAELMAKDGCYCDLIGTEFGDQRDNTCSYHDEMERTALAKRLARWLKWRDGYMSKLCAGPNGHILSEKPKALKARQKQVLAMLAALGAESVAIDHALDGAT